MSRLQYACLAIIVMGMLIFSSTSHADESSCIVCHTDIDLLEENLGEGGKKKSALQAGSG
jgi:hypothetical protein